MTTVVARKTFRFLTAHQVHNLHDTWIYPIAPLSQSGLLESGVVSPRNIKHYTSQDNVFQLAAAISEKIMKNHAFQDGNKRTALIAADMFLKVNGYQLQSIPLQADSAHDQVNQQLTEAHVAMCTNKLTAQQLGELYQTVAVKIEERTEAVLMYKNEHIEE